jgi:hypothetical protein
VQIPVSLTCLGYVIHNEANIQGETMADNLQDRGPQDRSRINVNERWELQYWTKHFGVSEEQLRSAVERAGPSVWANSSTRMSDRHPAPV